MPFCSTSLFWIFEYLWARLCLHYPVASPEAHSSTLQRDLFIYNSCHLKLFSFTTLVIYSSFHLQLFSFTASSLHSNSKLEWEDLQVSWNCLHIWFVTNNDTIPKPRQHTPPAANLTLILPVLIVSGVIWSLTYFRRRFTPEKPVCLNTPPYQDLFSATLLHATKGSSNQVNQ